MDHAAYPHLATTGNIYWSNTTKSYRAIARKLCSGSYRSTRGRYYDAQTDTLDSVGNWLSGTNEFREWRSNESEADKAVFFYCRNLEVRKTYLIGWVTGCSGRSRNYRWRLAVLTH